MDAAEDQVKIRSSYNLAGVSFDPEEVAASIRKQIPAFEISYEPDFRQEIADTWPKSIDDQEARKDWGWKHKFDLDAMTKVMLENLGKQYGTP
jgi:nucleoside-diphosphate-sugar epimerase